MSCILRVGGQELDVGALLKQLPFTPYRTWCKGDVHGIKKRILTDSGAAFDVSQADLDEFDQQIEDATAFLEKHGASLEAMTAFPGVEYAVLDFGIEVRDEYAAYSDCLPARFIRAVATTCLDVELSHYRCCEEDEGEEEEES